MKRKAKILLIDDQEEWPNVLSSALQHHDVASTWRLPQDVGPKDLIAADLVLVDLDLGNFNPTTFPLLDPPDGLALTSLMRRQQILIAPAARPLGFALVSGKVDELASPFPSPKRSPLLAKHHNLEWVFRKESASTCAKSVASLARAIRDIPKTWGDGIQHFEELSAPLGIAGSSDLETCWAEIEKCHPPVFEITNWTHGLALVRWMLHTILHYPCFLWDEYHVAARLRISHAAFTTALRESPRFKKLLEPSKYQGILSDFCGDRWWRHRIEALAWEMTAGDSQNSELLRKKISTAARRSLEPSLTDVPFVCRDKDYNYVSEAVTFEQAVRVQPDDWPPYADAAWMRIEDVKEDPALRALVLHDDRAKLTRNLKR